MLLALILGLLHGLIYVFLIPPWQHYDEPNHFEYAWLVANRSEWPESGAFDPEMNRMVVESMITHGFYDGMGGVPDLNVDPVRIGGYAQLDEPPAYYFLVSLPLRFLSGGDITYQLYLGRLVSLTLYLISILAAWGVVGEITVESSPLRWMVPVTLALLPGYTDLMTAVNNDVGAIAFFSVFLWGGVRFLKRGFSWIDFLWTAGMAVICYYTKSTVVIAFPLLLIVLLFGLFHGSWRWLAWGALLAGGLVGLIAIVTWGDAAYWYRSTSQASNTRVASEKAVIGDFAFQLDTNAEVTPRWIGVSLFQPLPLNVGLELRGKSVTLGAWMWSSQPIDVRTPILNDGTQSISQVVALDEEPDFYTFLATTSESTQRVWVSLSPLNTASEDNVSIYYDGLVLVEGERTIQEAPQFTSEDGRRGLWGGEPFENLLRNASAERGSLRFRYWADNLGAKFTGDNTRPSLILTSIFDWKGAAWFYLQSSIRLLRTFWAQFGWAHVWLIGHKPYRILAFFTLLGIVGAVIGFYRRRDRLPGSILLLLGLVLIGVWGSTLTRGPLYLAVRRLYMPVARYAYPAVIPTVLVLNIGWLEMLRQIGNWLRLKVKFQNAVYLLLFISLDVVAILSIIRFYGKI